MLELQIEIYLHIYIEYIEEAMNRKKNRLADIWIKIDIDTGDFMKNVPTATCALRDRQIVSIELVYTPSTFYMKSAVVKKIDG